MVSSLLTVIYAVSVDAGLAEVYIGAMATVNIGRLVFFSCLSERAKKQQA